MPPQQAWVVILFYVRDLIHRHVAIKVRTLAVEMMTYGGRLRASWYVFAQVKMSCGAGDRSQQRGVRTLLRPTSLQFPLNTCPGPIGATEARASLGSIATTAKSRRDAHFALTLYKTYRLTGPALQESR